MGGVACEEEPPVSHRLADVAAHPRDPFLEDRPLVERPAFETEARLQLVPDAVVRPLGDLLVRAALHVETAELRRAEAQERESALVVRVDELVVRRRDRGEDSEPAELVLARELGQHACRNARAADPVEPVAARDHVAFELVVAALVPVPNERTVGLEVVHRDVRRLEVEISTGLEAETDQVLDDLGLTVDDDRPSVGEVAQRDAVPFTCELQFDAVVHEALAQHALARAGRDEEVDDRLLEDAGADACLDVLAAPILQDHRVDALQVQEVSERESRWACTDDPYSGAGSAQVAPSSSSTCWAIANAPFAAGTPQ